MRGFERYSVSECGDVYDAERKRNICQWVDNVGYLQCVLYKDKKKHHKRVHRLIADAFIENKNNLPQVNHINGNKKDNNYKNLEWVTNSYNTKHGYDNNLYQFKRRSHRVVVLDKNNNYIRTYKSIRAMCDSLGLNRKTVTSILKKEKETNNYKYNFKYEIDYVKESQQTIESIVS